MGLFDNISFNNFKISSFVGKINKLPDGESGNRNIFKNPSQELPEDVFEKAPTTHISNPDPNIDNENAGLLTDDNSLKIEIKIEKTEERLKKVEDEINITKLFELDKDGKKLEELNLKKQSLEEEIKNYRSEYRNLGWIYKTADYFTDLYNKSTEFLNKVKVTMTEHPAVVKIKYLIPGWRKNEEIKQSLEKLCMLDNNLKGILSKSVNPFGESENKLNDFVAYMTQANKISFQANKFFRTKEQFVSVKEVFINNFNKIKNSVTTGIKKLNIDKFINPQ